MANTMDLSWLTAPRHSPDQIIAGQIHNGKSWIENAKEARDREWSEFLDSQTPLYLWPEGAPDFDAAYGQRQPALYAYPQIRDGEAQGAIIISAGGGYIYKSIWEAEPVARFFYKMGFATFIMDYRVKPYRPLIDAKRDALRSVRYLRCHAKELNVRPDRIAVLGGSSGAMQSGMAATLFDDGRPDDPDPVERVSSRPDACILSYGIIAPEDIPLGPSEPFDWEARRTSETGYFSIKRHLNRYCPPFFIWQTNADDPRPACAFCTTLTSMGLPFEFHVFPEGAHGCGLADGGHPFAPYSRSTSRWPTMVAEFLENLDFVKALMA